MEDWPQKLTQLTQSSPSTTHCSFFVSESEVTPHNIDLLPVKGYKLITSNTLAQGKSRNVCYCVEGLLHKIIPTNALTEIIAIEMEKCLIIGCYRPFKLLDGQTSDEANDIFFNTLRALTNTSSGYVYIGGDFNVNLRKKSTKGRKYVTRVSR